MSESNTKNQYMVQAETPMTDGMIFRSADGAAWLASAGVNASAVWEAILLRGKTEVRTTEYGFAAVSNIPGPYTLLFDLTTAED